MTEKVFLPSESSGPDFPVRKPMDNMAFSDRYLAWREQCTEAFSPDCRSFRGSDAEEYDLDHHLRLNIQYYEGKMGGCRIHGSDCTLSDQTGRVLYRWRSLNNDGDFHRVIRHADGREYFLFRRDLYGYSVLDLALGEASHYLPYISFPDRKQDFEETFIWTDVHYDPHGNVLAVSGCFWACPASVMLLDFSRPLSVNGSWVILHDVIADGYDIYDDIEFVSWEADGSLTVICYNVSTAAKETLILDAGRIRKLLDKP